MISLSEKINNFFNLKKNKNYIYIIVLIIVVLLILFSGNEPKEAVIDKSMTESSYNFENELLRIISEMSGVGRVSVFVNYESGKEEIVQTDITEKNTNGDLNRDEKTVIIGSGNTQKPFIKKELYPKIAGIIVVCDGGGDVGVKNNIIYSIKAVTGLSATKIGVFKMKSGGRNDSN